MHKRLVMDFDQGSLSQGVPVLKVTLSDESGELAVYDSVSLPAAPELLTLSQRWQEMYAALTPFSTRGLKMSESGLTHISIEDFESLCQDMAQQLNQWLRTQPFATDIEAKVRAKLDPEDAVEVLIATRDDLLQRLPWHSWAFFNDYRRADYAFSALGYERPQPRPTRQKIRLLAILCDVTGIDLKAERLFLQGLPDVEVDILETPTRKELQQQLWSRDGFDILFFAGHSCSEGKTGRLYLNEGPSENSLTIKDLEEAFRESLDQGVQLAIFNSCDGLGIADSLAHLNIPHVIVMREPVVNLVAQEFLQHFLTAFAREKLPLYQAMRQARRKLEGIEDQFRGASSLPVLFHNPTVPALSWAQLLGQAKTGASAMISDSEGNSGPMGNGLYVERSPIETRCYETILSAGAMIRVKAPQKLGKTMLLDRVLDYARQQGLVTVKLDLRLADQSVFSNLETFLQWVCLNTADSLVLEDQLEQYWRRLYGLNQNCTRYFQNYILEQIEGPMVLAFDNFDLLFGQTAIFQDFCKLLRGWHELAKDHARGLYWRQMRLIVVNSTQMYPSLNTNHSPFNVGLAIELPEFTLTQLEQLAQQSGLDWTKKLGDQGLAALMAMVGGHPYLVQLALEYLKYYPVTLAELLALATTEGGLYGRSSAPIIVEPTAVTGVTKSLQKSLSRARACQS